MLGADQPIILHLLDIEPAKQSLEGVKMELIDAAFPLLKGKPFGCYTCMQHSVCRLTGIALEVWNSHSKSSFRLHAGPQTYKLYDIAFAMYTNDCSLFLRSKPADVACRCRPSCLAVSQRITLACALLQPC